MKEIVYISLNEEDEQKIYALQVSRNSYGWAGELEIVERPYFKVVDVREGRPVLRRLESDNQEAMRVGSFLIDGQIPKNITRIPENEIAKYLPSTEQSPVLHL